VVDRWQEWREMAANHLAKQLLNHQREVLSLASLVSHCAAFGGSGWEVVLVTGSLCDLFGRVSKAVQARRHTHT
jgi:hypothetical protein